MVQTPLQSHARVTLTFCCPAAKEGVLPNADVRRNTRQPQEPYCATRATGITASQRVGRTHGRMHFSVAEAKIKRVTVDTQATLSTNGFKEQLLHRARVHIGPRLGSRTCIAGVKRYESPSWGFRPYAKELDLFPLGS